MSFRPNSGPDWSEVEGLVLSEVEGLVLSEVEGLKGENLQLKFDSLDKQMRLLQEQFARLQQAQKDLVAQLQELEADILRTRGFHPGEAGVNWQAKKIEKMPPVRPAQGEQRHSPPPVSSGPQGGDAEREKEEGKKQ